MNDTLPVPEVGTIEQGYRFNGGDPSDRKNWTPVRTEALPQLPLPQTPPRDVIGPMPGQVAGEPFGGYFQGPSIRPPTMREKIRQLPLISGVVEPYTEMLPSEIQQITSGASRDVPTTPIEAIQQGSEAVLRPLAKPSQLAIIGATAGAGELAPVINRIVAGYFGARAAQQIKAQIPILLDPKVSQNQKLKTLVEIGGEGVITYLAGKQAIHPTPGAIKSPVEDVTVRETPLAPDMITAAGIPVGGTERLPLPEQVAPAPTGMLVPPTALPPLDPRREAPAPGVQPPTSTPQIAPAPTTVSKIPELQLPKVPSLAQRSQQLPSGVNMQEAGRQIAAIKEGTRLSTERVPQPEDAARTPDKIKSAVDAIKQQFGELEKLRKPQMKERPGETPPSPPAQQKAGIAVDPYHPGSPRPYQNAPITAIQDLMRQYEDVVGNLKQQIKNLDASPWAKTEMGESMRKEAQGLIDDANHHLDFFKAEIQKRAMASGQGGIGINPMGPLGNFWNMVRDWTVPRLQEGLKRLNRGVERIYAWRAGRGKLPAGVGPTTWKRFLREWQQQASIIDQALREKRERLERMQPFLEQAVKEFEARGGKPRTTKIPVTEPSANPTLENIAPLDPQHFFEVVKDWMEEAFKDESLAGLSGVERTNRMLDVMDEGIESRAIKAARDNPDVAKWEAAYKAADAEHRRILDEVRLSGLGERSGEVNGSGYKTKFLADALEEAKNFTELKTLLGPHFDAPGYKLLFNKYGSFPQMYREVMGTGIPHFPRTAKRYLRSIGKVEASAKEVQAILDDMAKAVRLNRPTVPRMMDDALLTRALGTTTPRVHHPVADALENPLYVNNRRTFDQVLTPQGMARMRGDHDGVILDDRAGDVIDARRFEEPPPGGAAPPTQPPPPAGPAAGGPPSEPPPVAPTPPAPTTELPPLLPGDKLVTVQRPDGSTYQAALSSKTWDFGQGPVPSIAKPVEGRWSHGLLGPGEKILGEAGQKPPPSGAGEASQSPVPPPVTGEGSAQVGGAEPPPTPPAISKPTPPPTDPSSGRPTGESGFFLIDPLQASIGKLEPTMQAAGKLAKDTFKALARARKEYLSPIVSTTKIMTQQFDAADNMANLAGRRMSNLLRLEKNLVKRRAAYVMIEANELPYDPARATGQLPLLGPQQLGAFHVNIAKLQEFIDIAKQSGNTEIQAAAEYAFKNSNNRNFLKYVEDAKQILEGQYNREVMAGINPRESRAAYMPQYFEGPLKLATGQPVMVKTRQSTWSPAKGQEYSSIFEAMQSGYKPRTIDIADIIEHRVRHGERLINREAWAANLEKVKDPETNLPIAVIPKSGTALPVGYSPIEMHPGMRVAVHPTYVPLFKGLTEQSAIANNAIGSRIMGTEAFIKHKLLVFDSFHLTRMVAREAAVTQSTGPIVEALGIRQGYGAGFRRGHSLLEWNKADLADAFKKNEISEAEYKFAQDNYDNAHLLIKQGLNVGRVGENFYNQWQQATGKNPLRIFQRYVFEKVTRGAMMESALREFERMKTAKSFGMTDEQIAQKVARDTNVYFGNLQRQGIFKSQQMRDIAQILFLAPQWVESMARTEIGSLRAITEPLESGKLGMSSIPRGVGTGLAAYFIFAQLVNLNTRGKFTWENPEEGHKLDAWIPPVSGDRGLFLPFDAVVAELESETRRYAFSKGGGIEGTTSAASRIFFNKMSPIARSVKIVTTGQDVDKRPLVGVDRWIAGALALAPSPILVSPGVQQVEETIGARPHTGVGVALQVERQLLASLGGLKTDYEPTKVIQAYQIVRDWKKQQEKGNPKIYKKWLQEQQSTYAISDYHDLRLYLANGNYEAARKQFKKMDKTPAEIERALSPFQGTEIVPGLYRRQPRSAFIDKSGRFQPPSPEAVDAFKPLGGLTRGEEQMMYKSLTPAQRDTYDKAKMERLLIYQRLHEALDPIMFKPSVEEEPKNMPTKPSLRLEKPMPMPAPLT